MSSLLYYLTLAAVLLSFLDFVLGDERRRKVQETVGDWWLRVHYASFPQVLSRDVRRTRTRLALVFGRRLASRQFILSTALFGGGLAFLGVTVVFYFGAFLRIGESFISDLHSVADLFRRFGELFDAISTWGFSWIAKNDDTSLSFPFFLANVALPLTIANVIFTWFSYLVTMSLLRRMARTKSTIRLLGLALIDVAISAILILTLFISSAGASKLLAFYHYNEDSAYAELAKGSVDWRATQASLIYQAIDSWLCTVSTERDDRADPWKGVDCDSFENGDRPLAIRWKELAIIDWYQAHDLDAADRWKPGSPSDDEIVSQEVKQKPNLIMFNYLPPRDEYPDWDLDTQPTRFQEVKDWLSLYIHSMSTFLQAAFLSHHPWRMLTLAAGSSFNYLWIVIAISGFPTLLYVGLGVWTVIAKAFEKLLRPATAFLLERFYRSPKGVLCLLSVSITGAAKLMEISIKHWSS